MDIQQRQSAQSIPELVVSAPCTTGSNAIRRVSIDSQKTDVATAQDLLEPRPEVVVIANTCDRPGKKLALSQGKRSTSSRTVGAAKARNSKTPTTSRKPRGKYKTKKEPSKRTKPKRALSAYNYFFRYERAKLLGCDPPSFDEDSDDNEEGNNLYTITKRRPHRKTHGQIGFTDLAKHIGAIWKQLDSKSRSFYEELASKDLKRYRSDLYTYKQIVGSTEMDEVGSKRHASSAQNDDIDKRAKRTPSSVKSSLPTPSPVLSTSNGANSNDTNRTRSPLHVKPTELFLSHDGQKAAAYPNREAPMTPTNEPIHFDLDQRHLVSPVMTFASNDDEGMSIKTDPVLCISEVDTLDLIGGPLEPLFSMDEGSPPPMTSASLIVPMQIEVECTISEIADEGCKDWDNLGDFDLNVSGDALVDYLCSLP